MFERHLRAAWVAAFLWMVAGVAHAQALANVLAAARAEQAAYLDTLKDLVGIESGSRDLEGIEKLAALLAARLEALGGKVDIVRHAEIYRMEDTPEKVGPAVQAVFKGTGTKRILLIAHMDTVYLKGMLKDQPFRIDGDRAYGLGIADDKQGVALIVHTVALLRRLGYDGYGELTVLVNSDEEISSPGARTLITRLGAASDAVLSYEGGGSDGTLRLVTSGIGSAYLTVQGRASHAGSRPEGGVNALYELSHQLLQMRDLSQPERGLKLNWTVSKSGTNRNVIPAEATAQADLRALRVADFDLLTTEVQKRTQNKLLAESKVSVKFEIRRPPLEATPANRKLAAHFKRIYADELQLPLNVADVAPGGGTDAAFAALSTQAAVVEGMGLSGFGAHSNDAEYVLVSSIVPRLYLSVRAVMDIAAGKP